MVDFKLPVWDNSRVGSCKPVQTSCSPPKTESLNMPSFSAIIFFIKVPSVSISKACTGANWLASCGHWLDFSPLCWSVSSICFPSSNVGLELLHFVGVCVFVSCHLCGFRILREEESETAFTLPSSNWKSTHFSK